MISASSISRKLREAGFGVVATRNREGIRVSRGAFRGRVSVVVDLDRPGEANRLADTLETWLWVNVPLFQRDGVHFTIMNDVSDINALPDYTIADDTGRPTTSEGVEES